MVRLQIRASNFKIYLKNDMAWPCQKGQASGLWMNQGGAVWTAPPWRQTGWGLCAKPCMDRRKASSCLAVSLLVEQHQLFVFLLKLPMHMREKVFGSQMAKECLPGCRVAITGDVPWLTFSLGLPLGWSSLSAPSTPLSLLSFSIYSLWQLRE